MQAYSLLILTVSTVHSANIVEVLQQKGATTLVDLAVKAGLGETLTGTRILKTELQDRCKLRVIQVRAKKYYIYMSASHVD